MNISKQNMNQQQMMRMFGGGGVGGGGGGGNRQIIRKQVQAPPQNPGGKLMRLRCRFRPLHDTYLVNDEITEKDSDVVFLCLDGRVRAHKIILASCSSFFANLFEGQLPGINTNVLVPDIPVATVRTILSLAYRDTVNLTPQQMKDASQYLKLFGFPSKLFSYDGNPLRPTNTVRTVPVTMPINTGVGVSGGKVRIVNQAGQLISKPSSSGNKIQTQGPTGAITVSASSIYRDVKEAQQRQQLAAAQQRLKVEAAEAEESDYKFQVQGYEPQQMAQKMIQQQRVINPQIRKAISGDLARQLASAVQQPQQRRVFPTSPLRRIAPKPPAQPGQPTVLEFYSGNEPQVQMETDAPDEDAPLDSEHGRLLIQEWMRNVGRDDTSSQSAGASKTDGEEAPKNQCMICNNVFDNEEKWRWHETHHVGLGLFKCAYCDELFSTSRKVYQHEMMEHGVTSGVGATDSPAIPSDFKIIQGRKRRAIDDEYEIVQPQQSMVEGDGSDPPKMTLVRTIHGTHYRRLPGTAGPVPVRTTKKYLAAAASGSPQLQQKYAKYASLARNFKARNPLIGIAKTDAEDLVEAHKVKQLHWLYVCSKCEHASDTSAKAETHYNHCYPDKEGITFESCVVKYRQGFFGKFQCPLCPKRYTSISGFTIHCGHMHSDYRRKFAHRHEDDTVQCIICKKKWKDPAEFQAHLSDDGDCTGTPVFGDGSLSISDWIGNGTPGEDAGHPPKRINIGTLSRSTRLANRILTTAQDETSFNPVDCPICGSAEISKIVDHLQIDHADLHMQVLRVADTTLRCQKCSISFALCDLLGHHGSCTGCKEFQFGGGIRRTRTSAGPAIPLPIPPGVGCSPIDTIECADLSSLETLRNALKCNVCQRTASKLGTIAECYRTHGIVRCALCFNTYCDKSSYSLHLKTTHSGTVANKLRCPLCQKEFTNVGQTAGHMYNNHWLTLLGSTQVARKGPRKFLPNLINLDQLGDAAAAAANASTGDMEGQDSLDSTRDGENDANASSNGGSNANTTDDYSNITIGSILESSVTNCEKNVALAALNLKPVAPKPSPPQAETTKGEESESTTELSDAKAKNETTPPPPPVTIFSPELEELLSEGDSKKSEGVVSTASSNADVNEKNDVNEVRLEEDDEGEGEETEDEMTMDETPGGDEHSGGGRLHDDGEGEIEDDEEGNYEEGEVEEDEEDDDGGVEMNDLDDIEIFPGEDDEDEDGDELERSTTQNN